MSQGQEPIVDVRPSDALAFCDWLTKREPDDNWAYRLPRPDETTARVFPVVGY